MQTSNMLDVTLFSTSGLIVCVTSTILGLILFLYGKLRLHKICALFNFAIALWGICAFFIGRSHNANQVLLLFQIGHIGIIFIAVFFYHFCCLLSSVNRRPLIVLAYLQGIVFVILAFINPGIPFISHVASLKGSFYYLKSESFIYPLMLSIWIVLVLLALFEIYRKLKIEENSIKRAQLLYILIWFCVGFTGGLSNFLPALNLNFVPLGNFTIPLYCIIATYAILRYKLLDVRIALTNTAIFIIVYALVLGIPFIFGYKYHQWQISTWAMLVLATAGPYIFFYLQRRVENRIFKEEKTMLEIVNKAMREIPHIKDLQHLFQYLTLNLRKLMIDHVTFYLWDVDSRSFIMKESVTNNATLQTFTSNDVLTIKLSQNIRPLNYDEVQFLAKDNKKKEYQDIIPRMEKLSAQIITPMIAEGALVGFIVLGKRGENRLYSEELMELLAGIGTLAGGAVTNYFYWEKMALEERRASMDHIADSIAHEFDNPVMVIQLQSEGIEEYLARPQLSMPDDLRKSFNRALDHIKEACGRLSSMVQDVKDHAKGTDAPKKLLKLNDVKESYWKMMGPAFNKHNIAQDIEYNEEIESDLPDILGNKIQLVQVLENFLKNSLHAVNDSKIKKIKLKIYRKNDDWIRIEFSDTGYGIREDLIKDIWLPHVTTKGSVEGQGLGLFIIRKIIESHEGRVWAESEGEGKGATMLVEFPVFKGELKELLSEEKPQKGPKTMF